MMIEMNIYILQPGGSDVVGIAEGGNSLTLPNNELHLALGLSSSEWHYYVL